MDVFLNMFIKHFGVNGLRNIMLLDKVLPLHFRKISFYLPLFCVSVALNYVIENVVMTNVFKTE